MLTLRALNGPIPTADVHALLTLVSYARPERVLELGATSGHVTANLTEWTDLETVIVSVNLNSYPETDHFGKASKVQRVEPLQFDAITPESAKFDVAVIHESSDVDRLLNDSTRAFDLLTPGGWLIWFGFLPADDDSPVRIAIQSAQLKDRVFHFANTRTAYLQKSPIVARRRKSLVIHWEGDIDVLHSLAGVNRALVDRLQMRGHVVSVTQPHLVPSTPMHEQHPSFFAINRPLPKNPNVIIRHTWPPKLARSSSDVPVVLIQPWEFGSPPKVLVDSLRKGDIAEWWVPSQATRLGIVQAGVPGNRIAVVPNGVDISIFRPEGMAFPVRTSKRFKFLFVGGTIWRKGIDILLTAYAQAFSAVDDVCLIVKDSGVSTHYQGQTAEQTIRDFQVTPDFPELEYHSEDLSDREMAELYRAANCLVHPYRGESFGMPVAEAMACGLAVVVTQHGATDDWCDERNAFLVPSRRIPIPSGPVCGMDTVGEAWFQEPDLSVLIGWLQFIVANPDQVRIKGQKASQTIRERLTWDHAVLAAESRLQRLLARRRQKSGARISLTMIVRNEESNLAECLGWTNELFDEIVIVDTGSTDRTREIAESFGAKVYEYPWSESFAIARNQAIAHATGDWIFWLDADDRIDEENRQNLEKLFDSLRDENAAFLMNCRCVGESGEIESRVDHIRLFRRSDSIRWRYRVHEQILPALQESGVSIHWSDVVITHVGYADAEVVKNKLHRDRNLLTQEIDERPEDRLVMFQLGVISQKMGQPLEAIRWLNKSLCLLKPGDNILPKTYVLLTQCHREIDQLAKASEILQAGRRLFPDDAELLYLEAIHHQETNNNDAAEYCYRELLSRTTTKKVENVAAGLRGYLARHGLACLFFEQTRYQEAIDQWRYVIQECPNFGPAITGLEESIRRIERMGGSPNV